MAGVIGYNHPEIHAWVKQAGGLKDQMVDQNTRMSKLIQSLDGIWTGGANKGMDDAYALAAKDVLDLTRLIDGLTIATGKGSVDMDELDQDLGKGWQNI